MDFGYTQTGILSFQLDERTFEFVLSWGRHDGQIELTISIRLAIVLLCQMGLDHRSPSPGAQTRVSAA